MFVVDTNVLIYGAEVSFPEHARCRQLLLEWRRQYGGWYTTWPVIYEFLRVTTHPRVFARPWSVGSAWTFVEALLASSGLRVLTGGKEHAAVARAVFDEHPDLRGNVLHDAHTAILMREHGIRRIYTRDKDFHRFSFVEPVDPLA